MSIISKAKVVPVIVIEEVENAGKLGKALSEGGLEVAEVTFRTECAAEAIQILSRDFPSMLVGAGTVLSVDQVKAAVDSGARFIVSPGLNKDVVVYCLKNSIPVFPGVLTPTEVQAAMDLGLDIVKFFPAEAAGGLKYMKAISAPYPGLKFIPTGGINQNNIAEYLKHPKVIACGGSWMASKKMIAENRFDEIVSSTRNVVGLINELI